MLAETLSAMPDSADIAVAAIDALPAILLNPLLDKASTAASISAPAQTVVATILDHAARQPDATAVIQGGHRLTYHQLVTVATTIAAKLASSGIGRGARVGLHLERTPLAIAAILGTMLRGASYVPIDLDAPDERKAFMVAEAGMAAILSAAPGNIAGLAAIAIGAPDARPDAATTARTLLPLGADQASLLFQSR